MKNYKLFNFLSKIYLNYRHLRGLFLLPVFFYSSTGLSALQGDSKWLIEKGDNVYLIARTIFPDDVDKQRQFRKEVVKINPSVFKGNANHMGIGQMLLLPGLAISKPAPVVVVASPEPPVLQTKALIEPEPVVAVEEIIAADPEDVIGKVVVSVGSMKASNRGTFRKLLRHSDILEGDILTTSRSAYTQIRMKDGALISLRPNTQLKIIDYRFNGKEDGTERSVMELLSGGFRTITGFIGHRNKQNYQVKTAVATIGIRGTHYGLMICADGSCNDESVSLKDGVYGGVVDGSVVVENDAGKFTFNNDQYFHVASHEQAPVEQLVPPPVFHGKSEKRAARNKDANDNDQNGDKKKDQIAESSEDKKPDRRDNKASFGDNKNQRKNRISKIKVKGDILGNLVRDTEPDVVPLLPPDRSKDNTIGAVLADNPLSVFPKLPPGVEVTLSPNGSGMLISFADIDGPGAAAIPVFAGGNNAIGLASGTSPTGAVINNLPVVVHEESNGSVHNLLLPSGGNGIVDTGGNPVGVNWGRWSPGFELTENGTALPTKGDLHFVYSDKITTLAQVDALKQLASTDQLVSLGGLNSKFIYNFAGGTTPTNLAGQDATLSALTVTADFFNNNIDYQLTVSDSPNGNGTFFNMQGEVLNSSGVPIVNPTTGVSVVPFANMADFQLTPNITCIGCTGQASAAFVGGLAEGIITTYSVQDATSGIMGAAVLTRP